jgi:hypothetical protein
LFDGALSSCTFHDALSIANSSLDSRLLSKYYLSNNSGVFTEPQIVAVSGQKGGRAWYDLALQSGRTDPVPDRKDPIPASPLLGGYASTVWSAAVPADLRYDPGTNPSGARPIVFGVARNIYGIDPAIKFALRPFDNVDVQCGLQALNARIIAKAQFIADAETWSSQPNTQSRQMWPSYSLPRKEAGGPLAANVYQRALKPIAPADYTVTFTAAELAQLAAIFPGGVCDWSKPGVGQAGVRTWASFGPSPTNLVFDVTKT